MPDREPLAINLGVDFGTSYVKACFRDLAVEKSKVIFFDTNGLRVPFLESVLYAKPNGELCLASSGAEQQWHDLRYLKMRLADNCTLERLPTIAGRDLNLPGSVGALSAFFLAEVIRLAKRHVLEHEKERVLGRDILWSSSIGVPVEYYETSTLDRFKNVFKVAWLWATTGGPRPDLDQVFDQFKVDSQIGDLPFDCTPVPEIGAAIISFWFSRESRPGMYVYFDVGGGTLDGVVFRIVRVGDFRNLCFYSGSVMPLGASVIQADVSRVHPDEGYAATEFDNIDDGVLVEWSSKVQRMVSKVIVSAKKKDPNSWNGQDFMGRLREQLAFSRVFQSSGRNNLPLFIGGGGAGIKWYRKTIEHSHYMRHLHQYGIPEYSLVLASPPKDLVMCGITPQDYHRFSIAYGLSIPAGEWPDFTLPKMIEEIRQGQNLYDSDSCLET